MVRTDIHNFFTKSESTTKTLIIDVNSSMLKLEIQGGGQVTVEGRLFKSGPKTILCGVNLSNYETTQTFLAGLYSVECSGMYSLEITSTNCDVGIKLIY